MECNYMNWADRRDAAVQNAQEAIDRQDEVAADFWRNQADFCRRMLEKMKGMAAQKWLDCNWFFCGDK